VDPGAPRIMSNKAHDHVHRLILSMSRAEKRYFTLYAKRNAQAGQSNHQLLFDAISAMEVYDEHALLERFKDAAFTHRFAITKRRLYETILRSLDAFHAEASLDARIHRGLHQVRILYDRSLYEDAAKLLHGLRRLARQHDRQPALFAVLEWERRLAERDNYAHVDHEHLERLSADMNDLLAEQQELDELWTLKSKLFFTLYRKGRARDEGMRKTVADLLAAATLNEPAKAHTSKAQFLRNHIQSAAAFATDDLVTCHHYLEANRFLLEQERERFDQEPVLVLSVLSNLAIVCVALGRYTAALKHLHAFRTAPEAWNMPENEDLDLKLFSTSYSLELGMYTRLGQVDRALALVPAVERGLCRYEDRLGPIRRAGFHYQLAYLHLMAGQPDDALRWTNRLLDGLSAEESNELATAGKLLYLVVLYEAGKKDLLAYALRNTERFLKARGGMHCSEPAFMGLMRALLRTNDRVQERQVFAEFRDAMNALDNEPGSGNMLDQFNALLWAESKLSDRSFAAVVQEGAHRHDQAA
jgi:hypothetical protein